MSRKGGQERQDGKNSVKKKGREGFPSRPSAYPARPARLVTERAEERGALVRVAPLRTERRSRERVLIGLAEMRVIGGRERREPLLRAARRVVSDFLRHVERDVR